MALRDRGPASVRHAAASRHLEGTLGHGRGAGNSASTGEPPRVFISSEDSPLISVWGPVSGPMCPSAGLWAPVLNQDPSQEAVGLEDALLAEVLWRY